MKHICKENDIPVIFLNLENKSILAGLNENPLNVLGYLPNNNKRTVALVDEVQYLDDPSNFLLKEIFRNRAFQTKRHFIPL